MLLIFLRKTKVRNLRIFLNMGESFYFKVLTVRISKNLNIRYSLSAELRQSGKYGN